MTAASLFATLGLNAEGYNSGVQAVLNSTNKMSSALGGIGTIATGGMALAAGAVAGIGVAAFNTASDITAAENEIAASLGRTREEARGLTHEMSTVWATGIVENMDEAASATIEVRQQMKMLADDEIGAVTTAALKLQDTFEDADLVASTNVANVLMTEFGITANQSMDLMAHGFQQGLATSGDFLDTIGEYGNLFATAGFSADQMFSIMQTGMAGGVLGTDKIADAIKEMQLILNEGGEKVSNTFTAIGLDYAKISASVASGDEVWADYFDKIVGGINSIEDPILKANTQVTLFGTMAEDLGSSFTEGLSASAASMNDMAGSIDKLDIKYNSLGDIMTRIGRQGLLMIEPLRAGILDFAESITPFMESIMNGISSAFEAFSIGDITGGLDLLGSAFSELTNTVTGLLSGWSETLSKWGVAAYEWLAEAVPLLAGKVTEWSTSLFGFLTENLPKWTETLSQWGVAAYEWLVEAVPPLAGKVTEWGVSLVEFLGQNLPSWIGALLNWQVAAYEWLFDALPPLALKVAGWSEALIGFVGEKLPIWLEALRGWGVAAYEWLANIMPPLAEKVAAWGQALIGFVGEKLPIWLEALRGWGVAAYEWLANAIPPLTIEIGRWSSSLLSYLADQLPTWIRVMLEWGTVAVKWIGDAIPPLIVAAGNFIGHLAKWATGTALPVIKNFAVEWAVAGYAWVRDKLIPEIGPALLDFLTVMLETFIDIQAALVIAAIEVGQGILTGIVQALSDGQDAVANKLYDIIQNGIDAAKAFFGIHSPSLVTAREIGAPLIDGVVVGIQTKATTVSNAIVSTIQSGIGAGQQVLDEYNASIGIGAGQQLDFSALVGSFKQTSQLIQSFDLPKDMVNVLQNAFTSMEEVLTNQSLSADLPAFFENLFLKAGQTIGESDLSQSAKDVLYGTLMEAKEAALDSGFEGDLSTFFENAFATASDAIQASILPASASAAVTDAFAAIEKQLSGAVVGVSQGESGANQAIKNVGQTVEQAANEITRWADFDPTGRTFMAKQAINSVGNVIEAGVTGAAQWAESEITIVEPVYLIGIASVSSVFEAFEAGGLRWAEFDADAVVDAAKNVFDTVDEIAKAAQDAQADWEQRMSSPSISTGSEITTTTTNSVQNNNSSSLQIAPGAVVVQVAGSSTSDIKWGVQQGILGAAKSRGW